MLRTYVRVFNDKYTEKMYEVFNHFNNQQLNIESSDAHGGQCRLWLVLYNKLWVKGVEIHRRQLRPNFYLALRYLPKSALVAPEKTF